MTTAKPTQDETWGEAIRRLAAGEARLVALWADGTEARMALSAARPEVELFRYAAVDGAFPSVGAAHAPAIRLERAIADLSGLKAKGAPDARPWLDHGRWPLRHPLGSNAPAGGGEPERYAFLGAEGVGLHQIPVGPVHAGIIEPGHFRFHASGETIVRLEERLGYVHKGVERLMARRRSRARRRARRPGQRRQHGRLPDRLRPRDRSGDRNGRAAAGGLAEGADGRDRAGRQSPRRHRRDLQRRLVRADARPYRRAARADVARRRRRFRPSADDGPRRAGRRPRRSRSRSAAPPCAS